MGDTPKMLYIQTSGVESPSRTAAPFFIASTACAMEMEATIVFTINGGTLLKKGVAETITIIPGSKKTVRDFMNEALAAGVNFKVCHQSLEQHELTPADLIEGVDVIGGATLNDLVLEADGVVTF